MTVCVGTSSLIDCSSFFSKYTTKAGKLQTQRATNRAQHARICNTGKRCTRVAIREMKCVDVIYCIDEAFSVEINRVDYLYLLQVV
jgi:hypothetical protein